MPGCKVGDRAIIIPGKLVTQDAFRKYTMTPLEELFGVMVRVVSPAPPLLGFKTFRVERLDGQLIPVYVMDLYGGTTDQRQMEQTPRFWDEFLDPIRGKPEEKKIGDPLAEARKQYQKDLMLTRIALERFDK